MSKEVAKGTLFGAAVGATEGALLGLPYIPVSAGTSPFIMGAIGGVTGGATAFATEVSVRKLQSRKSKTVPSPANREPVAAPFTDPTAQVDITVESTSTTKRADVEEEEALPIVKTSSEQATGVPLRDIADTLSSARERVLANAFPMWQTTIQEKIVASASDTSVYAHTPRRVG